MHINRNTKRAGTAAPFNTGQNYSFQVMCNTGKLMQMHVKQSANRTQTKKHIIHTCTQCLCYVLFCQQPICML